MHTLNALRSVSRLERIVVVVSPTDLHKLPDDALESDSSKNLPRIDQIKCGGATRAESVFNGLTHLLSEGSKNSGGVQSNDWILVHDAARALATTRLAQEVLVQLQSGEKAVIPGLELIDTVKVVDASGYVVATPDRKELRRVQTPQGFSRQLLVDAHASQNDATDDGALVEAIGHKVLIIKGEERALKITTPADLATAISMLGTSQLFRTGVGVDAHAFAEGRQLWLAGLLWPDQTGVDGHSDGDVAAHAICDALFAAAQLGDLGTNFGTDKPEYSGASGVTLLKETLQKISASGYVISNVTVQIIGNRPKLADRRSEAIATLSAALGGANVSVLATTTDGMGLTGEGRGIAAIASALLIKQG